MKWPVSDGLLKRLCFQRANREMPDWTARTCAVFSSRTTSASSRRHTHDGLVAMFTGLVLLGFAARSWAEGAQISQGGYFGIGGGVEVDGGFCGGDDGGVCGGA
jgi:hypothetical protein